MSGSAPIEPEASPCAPAPERWRVRGGAHEDIADIAAAVGALVVELGGTPPALAAMQDATRTLLEDPDAGALLIARSAGALVGVLGASWQAAIHAGGRYALIQELWVDPAWRGRDLGGALLGALLELARERGLTRVEVGLPHERFAGIRATEAFYRNNGFTPLGPRMRRAL